MALGDSIRNLFSGGLTRPGVVDPATGQVQFFDANDPSGLAAILRKQPVPTSTAVLPEQPIVQDAPDGANFRFDAGGPSFIQEDTAPTKIAKPSFQQASTDASGMPIPALTNPATTKLGKLMGLLTTVVQGGLAGQAASEREVAQSGGHRGGGFGQGFQAAQQLPFQQASMRQDVQRGAIANQAQQMALDQAKAPVTVNGQTVPFWMAKRNLDARHVQSEIDKNNAQASKAGYIPIPGVGLGRVTDSGGMEVAVPRPQKPEDLKTAYDQAVLKAVNEHRDPSQDPDVQAYANALKLTAKEAAVNRDDKAIAIEQKRQLGQPLTPEETAYETAYKSWVKENKIDPGVARAQMFVMGRPVQVIDPNNPDVVTYQTAGQAIKSGSAAPSSIPFQTEKGVAKAFTTGKPAEELVAFNTAIQHADLLKQAATALSNNDVRTINSIKNRIKTEFGVSDPTNFKAIADAYTREVNKALTAGHITDAEIKEIGSTIPANASPNQIMGTIDAYKNLMASKVNIRRQQYEAGRQGKPNFGNVVSGQTTSGGRPPLSSFEKK